jgi:allophanate hydrolase subunit 1
MSEKRPMTAAERQRKYRQNSKITGERLDMYVSSDTGQDIESLSKRYSVTKKELIELLVRKEAIDLRLRADIDEEKFQSLVKLDCLVNHYRVTKDEVIDKLVNEAYEKVIQGFKDREKQDRNFNAGDAIQAFVTNY